MHHLTLYIFTDLSGMFLPEIELMHNSKQVQKASTNDSNWIMSINLQGI